MAVIGLSIRWLNYKKGFLNSVESLLARSFSKNYTYESI